jgi:hypothetical protein
VHLDELKVEGFRIYGAALPMKYGRYRAGFAVCRDAAWGEAPIEVARSERLAGGYEWADPEDALRFAMFTGRWIVRSEQANPRLRPVVPKAEEEGG